MPNIVRQECTRDFIEIETNGGHVLRVTRQQIRNLYQQTTGTPAERRAATLAAIRDAIPDAVRRLIRQEHVYVDFDVSDGGPVELTIGIRDN